MVDSNDGSYSRAPQVEDLVALCGWLNDQQAKYILIGGFAMILHGSVRGTKDIDLLIQATPANLDAVKRALGHLPDNAVADVASGDVEEYGVVRVADEIVVDLMASACGIAYAEAEGFVEYVEVDGVTIPTADKQLLIRTKQTYRDSDRADVLYLQAALAEEAEG